MGNILTQKRNGGGASPTALDELTYNYHTTTDGLVSNRLYQVNDVVSAGNYTDDIDDQGTYNNTHSTIETANNYGYDELGNLVRDAQEEIASIEWTVYGKMKKITRAGSSTKADLEFGYDASGNRLWKKVTPKGSGAVISTYYYLRDAQGNEMCRYVKYTNTTSQLMYVAQEHSIYGSSRVGVDGRKDTLYKAGNYSPSWGGVGTSRRELGLKSFELANHLGNVLVTVSDKPVYKVSSGTIYFQSEITSISDYYPFGAPINGRSFSSTEYRFSFQGQEADGEMGTQDYGFRIYKPALGKFLSVDQLIKVTKQPYLANNNNPIYYNDPTGMIAEVPGDIYSSDGRHLKNDGTVDEKVYVVDKSKIASTGRWAVKDQIEVKGMTNKELNLRASLSTLKQAEAGRLNKALDYNTWNNNKNFTEYNYSENPEVYKNHPGINPNSGSSAAGAYQFLKKFYIGDDFSPQSQDKAAVNNMTSQSYAAAISGNMTIFKESTKGRWTSLNHWTVPQLQIAFNSYVANELSGNSTIATPVGSLLKNN
jgi:RHS repeat-associated protein